MVAFYGAVEWWFQRCFVHSCLRSSPVIMWGFSAWKRWPEATCGGPSLMLLLRTWLRVWTVLPDRFCSCSCTGTSLVSATWSVDHAQRKTWLLLVVVDAFLKWPEVFVVNSTSATQTAGKLRHIFATHGLPVTLVSDNGPPFSSEEFRHFMTSNGITHRWSPPYHPSSNRMAENMVKSVKQALNKANKWDTMETTIAKFLAGYRNASHSVNGRTPAEILLGHAPRTRLSLVHPCLSQRMTLCYRGACGKSLTSYIWTWIRSISSRFEAVNN